MNQSINRSTVIANRRFNAVTGGCGCDATCHLLCYRLDLYLKTLIEFKTKHKKHPIYSENNTMKFNILQILLTIILFFNINTIISSSAFTIDHHGSDIMIPQYKAVVSSLKKMRHDNKVHAQQQHSSPMTKTHDKERQEWNERSIAYYSKFMREERRRTVGQIRNNNNESSSKEKDFELLAKRHYFALRKIKDGQNSHAETIYNRIIQEIMEEEKDGQCDHAKLAVTTLLLALHTQRMGDLKKTRSVFLTFFREIIKDEQRSKVDNVSSHNNKDGGKHHKCACSAKVLGAFALFEMKQGNTLKSLEIAERAVEFDPALGPVLQWKQFRDVRIRKHQRTNHNIGKR
jgi:hypothetical protein